MALKIVVGLGNPGSEYERTPHNVGFRVVDQMASACSAVWRVESKFNGATARIRFQGVDAILLKPLTYMNLSGESVGRLMRYYNARPEDLTVISDDADLPLGKVRVKPDGGHGGHRGLKSVIEVCGSKAFARVRVGIGRSVHGAGLVNYVLSHLSSEDEAVLQRGIDAAAEATGCLMAHGVTEAMNRFNGGGATGAKPRTEN